MLDNEAKGASPALMETEGLLGGTMGTCLGVARLPSRFDLLRMVLDFLFGCHNLNCVFRMGDALRSVTIRFAPLLISPHLRNATIDGASERRAGSYFKNPGAGSKKAG